MQKRRWGMLLAASLLVFTGLMSNPIPAQADHDCPVGYVCAYKNAGHTLLVRSAGDRPSIWLSVGAEGGYVWNNGHRYYNNDHIYLLTRSQAGTDWWTCLHYPETGGSYRTKAYLGSNEIIRAWFWGRECPDDYWHIGNPDPALYQ